MEIAPPSKPEIAYLRDLPWIHSSAPDHTKNDTNTQSYILSLNNHT
jgi:hypothetical protein